MSTERKYYRYEKENPINPALRCGAHCRRQQCASADEAVTLAQADVNGDGTVNTADVVEVYVKMNKGFKGWGDDSDDSEFGGAKERRGTWGNLWETEN